MYRRVVGVWARVVSHFGPEACEGDGPFLGSDLHLSIGQTDLAVRSTSVWIHFYIVRLELFAPIQTSVMSNALSAMLIDLLSVNMRPGHWALGLGPWALGPGPWCVMRAPLHVRDPTFQWRFQ